MKMVEGNLEDKYNTKHPISRLLVHGFLSSYIQGLKYVNNKQPVQTVIDVGCGEGILLTYMRTVLPVSRIFACDISEKEIKRAKTHCKNLNIRFATCNAENLHHKNNTADLVTCMEVLEHVKNPERVFHKLLTISTQYVLVSIPHEPVWRFLNVFRLKYLQSFGNTPGHINHWSVWSFRSFIRKNNAKIIKSWYPLPWQMYLISKTP